MALLYTIALGILNGSANTTANVVYKSKNFAQTIVLLEQKITLTTHLGQNHVPGGTFVRGGSKHVKWYTWSQVSHISKLPASRHTEQMIS